MKKGIIRKIVSLICCLSILFSLAAGSAVSASAEGIVSLRIEGAQKTIFSGDVALQNGDTVYDLLVRKLDELKIKYDMPDSGMGRYINSIGDDAAFKYDKSTGWLFYMNGESSAYAINQLKPTEGDKIVLAFGSWNDTYYPKVTMTPQNPLPNEEVKLNVAATYFDWAANVSKTIQIADANVHFNGALYKTDSNGSLNIKMPDKAGTYQLSVDKDRDSNYPQLVRSGDISVVVYDSRSVTPEDGSRLIDLSDPSHPVGSIDVSGGSATSVKLNSADQSGQKTATVPNDLSVKVRNGCRVFELKLSKDTKITGSSAWNGIVTLPELIANDAASVAGVNVRMAVEIGASNESLSLDKPARLILPMQSGKKAGYIGTDGAFHKIEKTLKADSVANDFTGDAVYDDGYNLVVYTTHFSKFIAYMDTLPVTDGVIIKAEDSAAAALSADSSAWSAFALARAGYKPSRKTLDALLSSDCGNKIPADIAKTALSLKANGYNPKLVSGNLYQKLYNCFDISKTGLNGPIFALLALKGESVPASAKWSCEKLIDEVLGYQSSNGSFAIDKTLANDPDMTAMAITALAPYMSRSNVSSAVTKAIDWLSQNQTADGGFVSNSGTGESIESTESVSQVIIALCSVGIDPAADKKFIKNGKSPIDNLMQFYNNHGFAHTQDKSATDLMSSEQALMALAAYTRFEAGKPALYDLSDVVLHGLDGSGSIPNPKTGDDIFLLLPAFLLSAAYVLRVSYKNKSL